METHNESFGSMDAKRHEEAVSHFLPKAIFLTAATTTAIGLLIDRYKFMDFVIENVKSLVSAVLK